MKVKGGINWKDVVKEALTNLGGEASLTEIYNSVEGHPKTESNPTWRATIRRTLQQYSSFYQKEKGSGIWLLKKEMPLEEFHPKKNRLPTHEDVQGMLLELGNVYGFETIVPAYDRQKRFLDKPLGEIGTLNEFPQFTGYTQVLKTVSLIDVMWFTGETDSVWIPRFAFEVEHTSDVTKGLGRLSDLYQSGQRVKLFVILPEEKKGKFEREIERGLFSSIKSVCNLKTYEPLIEIYNMALEHNALKMNFFGE